MLLTLEHWMLTRIKFKNMQTELTHTIAEMSEVVAKYMGWETVLSDNTIHYFRKQNNDIVFIEQNKFRFTTILDWGICHEVWEKVREDGKWIKELNDYFGHENYVNYNAKCSIITIGLCRGTPLETLTALYNCIQFINQLKENNGNKSI